jgi:hypothetical protein
VKVGKSSEGNKTLTRLGIVAVLTAFLLSSSAREGRHRSTLPPHDVRQAVLKPDHVSIAMYACVDIL